MTEQSKKENEDKQTKFPESSAAHLDGTEPSATCLVLSNTHQSDSVSEVQTLEHLVNFAYINNCPPDTILWPVLPLRL
jgi:hypothetical protein